MRDMLFEVASWFNVAMQAALFLGCTWLAMTPRYPLGWIMTLGVAMMAVGAAVIVGVELDGYTCTDLIPVHHARALFNVGLLIAGIGYAMKPVCPFKRRGRQ